MVMASNEDKMVECLSLAVNYGQINGASHKAWVIDQIVRVLTGKKYDTLVVKAKAGEDGPETYKWDCGIAP